MFKTIDISILLSIIFFASVCSVIIQNPQMFMKKLGRSHSMNGLTYLLLILLGFVDIIFSIIKADDNTMLNNQKDTPTHVIIYIFYDVILGIMGIMLPLTAAYEFKHHNIKNIASGTLDEHATVTYNEMIEHSFYQGLNLLQIIYIHLFNIVKPTTSYNDNSNSNNNDNSSSNSNNNNNNNNLTMNRIHIIFIILSLLVTSPWLIRHYFPIHKFSDNYVKNDIKSTKLIRFLYRIKKYQYIFYKHFLLHGLNISLACYYSPLFYSINNHHHHHHYHNNHHYNNHIQSVVDNSNNNIYTTINNNIITLTGNTILNINNNNNNMYTNDIQSNISSLQIGSSRWFRLYWLLLNTAYVMEFFLQTLVKKKYVSQSFMLILQQILMIASSFAAYFVLKHVIIMIALFSLVLNLINRKYDFWNVCLIYFCLFMIQFYYRLDYP